MIINGLPVDNEILNIQKSISSNLQNKTSFQSENVDTAENIVELKPPIPMKDCLYIFENSSFVAKCCRVLADDIIYNDIILTINSKEEPSEKLVNQVKKINEFINENLDELHNLAIDYYYAGWGAIEYTWDNTKFSLKQIPIHTCKIVRVTQGQDSFFLLKQQINSKIHYFKIMGETYPENISYYGNQKFGYVSLLGGDNVYQFFSLPRWSQDYTEILTEIAISNSNFKTISNGNISSGILNINLEPQLNDPFEYDDDGKIVEVPSRQEVISEELQSATGGVAVIFTESNRPVQLDYVSLVNSNHEYLADLSKSCQEVVLNDYNVPLVRLMINTEKESMNSNRTQSIWEIYTLVLKNEQRPFKLYIKELIKDLYNLDVNVDISTPIFSDRREIEVNLISQAWNDGALTLKQLVTGLSEYISSIDLNDYDFTLNPSLWEYRKIPDLDNSISPNDEELIAKIEAQLEGL